MVRCIGRQRELVVGDVILRETRTCEAVMKAMASGQHMLEEIGSSQGGTSSYPSPCLSLSETLHLSDHRLPATILPDRHGTSRSSRYNLAL